MWLYVPCQSARVDSASSLGSTSLALDYSDLCVTVNAKRSPWKRLSTSRRREQFPRLLSGLMCGRSAMQTAAESWAKSRQSSEEYPASPTLSPAASLVRMMNETFGPQHIASLRRTNRSSLCSLRTSQGCFLPEEPAVSSKIWSDWVSRLRAASLLRRKSARATSGSGCSSWPTAKTATGKYCYSRGDHDKPVLNLEGSATTWRSPQIPSGGGADSMEEYGPAAGYLNLMGQSEMWHTPTTPDRGPETKESKATRPGTGGIDLQTEVKLWHTPHGMGNTDSTGKLGGAGGGEFAKQANAFSADTPSITNCSENTDAQTASEKVWPTPETTQGDFYKCPSCSLCFNSKVHPVRCPRCDDEMENLMIVPTIGPNAGQTFNFDTQQWPTPAGRDVKGANDASHLERSTGSKHLDQLPNFVSHCFPPAPQTSTPGDKSSKSTPRLNPRFVEWLMGWPRDWSQCVTARADCDYLGTVLSPYKRRMRSCLLQLCCLETPRD